MAETSHAKQEALPESLACLARQLTAGGQAPLDVLGPVTAVRELETIAGSVIDGHGEVNDHDAASVRRDIRIALDGFGPAATQILATDLSEIRAQFDTLPALLRSASTARRVAANAAAVRIRMQAPEVIDAAWEDTVAAFSESTSFEECETRLRATRELAELRGHDWTSLARDLRACLKGEHAILARAGEDASLDGRLSACRWYARRAMPEGEVIVWVGFQEAHLDTPSVAVGPIEFYALEHWPDSAAEHAPELADIEHGSSWFFENLLVDPGLSPQNMVLARVDLGRINLARAASSARQLAHDAIVMAHGRTGWQLLEGAAVFVAGASGEWFGEPLRMSFWSQYHTALLRAVPENDETGLRLAETNNDALLRRIRAGEHDALEALDFLRWSAALAEVPDDAQRLALSLRLIERALTSLEDQHWSSGLSRYVKLRWEEARLRGELIGATWRAAVRLRRAGDGTLWDELFTPLSRNVVRADIGVLASRTATLRDAMPVASHEHRWLEQQARAWESGPEMLAWLNRQGTRFDVLLDRSARQRNAVLHGADTVATVVTTARRFIGGVQAALVVDRRISAADGLSLLTRLELGRIRALERREQLRAGASPLSVLFLDERIQTISLTSRDNRAVDQPVLVTAGGTAVDLAAWPVA